MQTIQAKTLPATNTKPTRIKAMHEGNMETITIARGDGYIEDDYCKAAQMLKDKLSWKGSMCGGHNKQGMVFVFLDKYIIE